MCVQLLLYTIIYRHPQAGDTYHDGHLAAAQSVHDVLARQRGTDGDASSPGKRSDETALQGQPRSARSVDDDGGVGLFVVYVGRLHIGVIGQFVVLYEQNPGGDAGLLYSGLQGVETLSRGPHIVGTAVAQHVGHLIHSG